jgi:elongation factor 1-beta
MTFTIKTEEGVQAVEKYLESNSYLSGGNAPGAQDRDLLAEIEQAKFFPDHKTSANLYGWWWTLAPFRENARALWGEQKEAKKEVKKPQQKEEEKKVEKKPPAEDQLDLFGDEDPEAEAAAKKQAEEKKKAKADADKKKVKAPIICKSEVVFDVKGYEADDDFDKIAAKIRLIQKEGLTWMDTHQIVPVGFGMNKLQMTMIIVDDLISTDDIFEVIEEWEEIQSVDISKFSKA